MAPPTDFSRPVFCRPGRTIEIVDDTVWLTEREHHAWRAFIRLQAELRTRMQRELQRTTGLSISDYEVLVLLSEAPGRRMRAYEIGAQAGWEKSRLSHHLTRMEQRSLVERQPCEHDTRYADIVLTERGHTAIVEAAPLHVAHVRSIFFDALSDEQVDALSDAADTVLNYLEKQPE
jgi:DNA-binding MarR family transcriptional regulator